MLFDYVKRLGVPLKVIHLDCSEEEIKRRLAERNKSGNHLSNVTTLERYMEIKNRSIKISKGDTLTINSELPVEESAGLVFEYIADLKQPS